MVLKIRAVQRYSGHDLQAIVIGLKMVTDSHDGGFFRLPTHARVVLGELALKRHIVNRFFNGRVRQTEPLLHEMDAQHGRHSTYIVDQLKSARGKAFLFHRKLTSAPVSGMTYAVIP